MAVISQSGLISISKNDRLANPCSQQKFISVPYPVKVCAIFRSARLISKKYRLTNPIKRPIISSASTVDGQPHPPPHSSATPFPPTTAGYDSSGYFSNGFAWNEKDMASEESFRDLYERWMRHNKVSRSGEEKERRFKVFKENVKHIHESNKRGDSHQLGLNCFGDTSEEEFSRMFVDNSEMRRSSENDFINRTGIYKNALIEDAGKRGVIVQCYPATSQGGRGDVKNTSLGGSSSDEI